MTPARTRVAVLSILACAWALLVVSCGDARSSTADYEQQLQSIMGELEESWGTTASAGVTDAGEARSPTVQIIDRHRRAQLSLRDAANRLDDIKPPEQVDEDHAVLIAGVRDMADAIDLLIEAEQVAASDAAKAKRLARQFATDDSFESVMAAANNIEKAGIDAGL